MPKARPLDRHQPLEFLEPVQHSQDLPLLVATDVAFVLGRPGDPRGFETIAAMLTDRSPRSPQRLFSTADYYIGGDFAQGLSYDVHPRSGRFLMLREVWGQDQASMSFTVTLNWFEELKQLVPVR